LKRKEFERKELERKEFERKEFERNRSRPKTRALHAVKDYNNLKI
jgi:hypothetical protein